MDYTGILLDSLFAIFTTLIKLSFQRMITNWKMKTKPLSLLDLLPMEIVFKIMSDLTLKDRVSLIRAWPAAAIPAKDPFLSKSVLLKNEDLHLTEQELSLVLCPSAKVITVSPPNEEREQPWITQDILTEMGKVMTNLESLTLINCALALRSKHCTAKSHDSPCFYRWTDFPKSLRFLNFKHCMLYACQICTNNQGHSMKTQCFSELFDQSYYACRDRLNFLNKITFEESAHPSILINLMDIKCDPFQRLDVFGVFKTFTLVDSLSGKSISAPRTPVNVGVWSRSEDREMTCLEHAYARILYGECSRPGYPNVKLDFFSMCDDEMQTVLCNKLVLERSAARIDIRVIEEFHPELSQYLGEIKNNWPMFRFLAYGFPRS